MNETKRAFYAGAGVMFGRMMGLSDLPANEAEAKITALFAEVQFFVTCEGQKTADAPGGKQ